MGHQKRNGRAGGKSTEPVIYISETRMTSMLDKKRIDCFTCRHFYITWDRDFRKGCRAMGFKCNEMPSIVVYQNSGVECLRYEPKLPRKQK